MVANLVIMIERKCSNGGPVLGMAKVWINATDRLSISLGAHL